MWGSMGTPPHGDRWAVIVALVNLRARVVVRSLWPRHARLAWLAQEEAVQQAFELGMRWAELDGHTGFACGSSSFVGHVSLPSLVADMPALAESFREGYGLMIGHPIGESERLLLSVFQVAEYLGRPEHDVLILMNEGVLACQWYGGERRVSFKDLEAYRIRDRDDAERAFEALLAVAELIERDASIRAA